MSNQFQPLSDDDFVSEDDQLHQEEAGLEDASVYGSSGYAGVLGGSVTKEGRPLLRHTPEDHPLHDDYIYDTDLPEDEEGDQIDLYTFG